MGFEAKMIKDSFELAKPIADKMVKRFYENLFSDYPQSKSLYLEGQMPEQQLAVLKSLIYIVDNLDNKEKLNTFLTTLSGRHDLGLGDSTTLQWVRSTFLKTLAEGFGNDWTSELSEQWNLAFEWVTGVLTDSKGSSSSKKSSDVSNVINFPGSSQAKCDLPLQVKNNIREEARRTVNMLLQREYQAALNAEIESLTDDSVKAVILKKVA